MACSSCGGNHVGRCPGVHRVCGECKQTFIAGNGWHNHSLCSSRCCSARREKVKPTYNNEEY